MPFRRLLWVLALSLLALPAQAALVLHYDFDDLADEADEVVHGRVVSQTSYWDGQVIVTQVTVEVLDCLKGEHVAGDRVIVSQQGGAVGDLAMVVPGMPSFADDEEVVLFLEASSLVDVTLVMGLAQGKFSVLTDAISGERLVTRDLSGLTRVDARGQVIEPSEVAEQLSQQSLEGLELTELIELSVPDQVRVGPVRTDFDGFMVDLRARLAGVSR